MFTPNVLLEGGRVAEFVALLNTLAEARAELLEPDDMAALAQCFDAKRCTELVALAQVWAFVP